MSLSLISFDTVANEAIPQVSNKVIVTGGAGFIGSHLVNALLQRKYQVIVVDNLNSYYDPALKRKRIDALTAVGAELTRIPFSPPSSLASSLPAINTSKVTFVEADICDYAALRATFETVQPRYVFHLAAQAGVRWCSEHPKETMKNNLLGTKNVLKCSSEVGTVTRVLFASSSTVYGNQPTPWKEDANFEGLGVYAHSKMLGELACREYPSLPVTIVRLFSVYGPDSRPDMAVTAFMEKLHQRKPITIYGDGSQARDNTYITDVVNAFILAAERPVPAINFSNKSVDITSRISNVEILNVGTSKSTTLNEMLSILQEVMKRVPAQVKNQPRKDEDALITQANVDRAKQVLGFEAQVNLRDGIQRCVGAFFASRPVHIAVLVATCNRVEILKSRCLAAIFSQQRLPDSLTIVDDSQDPSQLQQIREWIQEMKDQGLVAFQLTVVPNARAKGASGAWNTGLLSILSSVEDDMKHNVFVAVCDDDDRWDHAHLRLCEEAVRATGCDMPVPGLIRHELDGSVADHLQPSHGRQQSIPLSLCIDDFLIGNPHVQGSNMFIRLDAIVQAGKFDEHLSACTDRDLLIRLLEIPGFLHVPVMTHTVHHYAEKNRPRMSTPSSSSKHRGLNYFFQKHHHRMSEEVKMKCLDRAFNFFNWKPTAFPVAAASSVPQAASSQLMTESQVSSSKCSLIVGITSDSNSHKIEPLLQDIARLQYNASDFLAGIDVVVLENGPRTCNSGVQDSRLGQAVMRVQQSTGLRCMLISLEQQIKDVASGALPSFLSGDSMSRRAPIAETRTSVQYYAAALAHRRAGGLSNGPVVWILDDDKRFGQEFAVRLRQLFAYRANHPDMAVVFGTDVSSPPLPTAFVVRSQLVDVTNNLHRVASSPPTDILRCRSQENTHMRAVQRDFFHDLASNSGVHLEYPFWLPTEGLSGEQAFSKLAEQLDGILAGALPMRQPLIQDSSSVSQTAEEPLQFSPSVNRGGCTFIFDLSCLTEVANYVPILAGVRSRRSDMIWSAVNLYVRGKTVVQCNQICVTHERNAMQDKQTMMEVVLQDIFGHALYTAFVAVARLKRSLSFTQEDSTVFIQTFTEALNIRKTSLIASLERIRVLSRILHQLLYKPEQWWNRMPFAEQPHVKHALDKFKLFTSIVEGRFDEQWELEVLKELKVSSKIEADLRQWLLSMSSVFQTSADTFRQPALVEAFKASLYRPFRNQSACFSIAHSLGGVDLKSFEYIGIGHEGVTFRLKGTNRAFKYMDLFAVAASEDEETFLTNINPDAKKLLRMVEMKRNGTHLIIEKEFVHGAHLSEKNKQRADTPLTLLLQCRKAHISFKNIKPDNILVSDADGSLVLVDVGRDVTAWSEETEKSMAKKLYLTLTWLHREDLPSILTRSISVPDENAEEILPELQGFSYFWLAFQHTLNPYLAQSDLFCIMTSMVVQTVQRTRTQSKPVSVLDYGCAEGKLTTQLQRALNQNQISPSEIVGFDLVNSAVTKAISRFGADSSSSSDGNSLRFTSSINDLRTGYSAIVCSRVLCCVDDVVAREILLSISEKLSFQGEAIISVCNPFFITLGSTPHQQRQDASCNPCSAFWYKKQVATGAIRSDCSRPFHVLRRMLLQAGLHIVEVQQTHSADVRNFRPNSDYLVLRVKRLVAPLFLAPSSSESRPSPESPPPCTLLIKSCYMEYESIYQNVIHLIRQLEGPRSFAERVLVVDSRKQGFARQYAQIGPVEEQAFRGQVERLQKEHWIDKVLYASNEPLLVASINQQWFGMNGCFATHAKNGAQINSTLQAINESTTDLILQVDSDLMIGRRSFADDYIDQTWSIFQTDPEAVTVSIEIYHNRPGSPTYYGESGPHRVEVRGSFFLKSRLLQRLPIPCTKELKGLLWEKGSAESSVIPMVGWHRIMDAAITQSHWGRSYRLNSGGGTFFIHPQNSLKKDKLMYGLIRDGVEKLRIPDSQFNQVDVALTLSGSSAKASNNWQNCIPTRNEDFVFIILGRNVAPDKFLRCANSVKQQKWKQCLRMEMYPNQPEKERRISCSAVVIDDCSDPHVAEFIRISCEKSEDTWGMPVTLIQPHCRRFVGANNVLAMRHVVNNPQSIIVTLDMDDALIGTNVISTLTQAYYEQQVEATVGNMLRTDKKRATNYEVSLENPRRTRGGGNVWKHLRSFRKFLFDRIEDEHLRLPNSVDPTTGLPTRGAYYTFATDWSYMIPIIEMAFKSIALNQVLYLYDAVVVTTEDEHDLTERAVEEIVQLPSYSKLTPMIAVVGDASLDLFSNRSSLSDEEFACLTASKIHHLQELGRKLIDEGYQIICGGMDGAMKEVCIGAHQSSHYHRGCTIGLLPGGDKMSANPFVDVCIPTSMNHARNILVAQADAVISVGGGGGTISEMAAAWAHARLVIGIPIINRAHSRAEGETESTLLSATDRLVGTALDNRFHGNHVTLNQIHPAKDATEAVQLLKRYLPLYQAQKRSQIKSKL